MSVVNTLEFLHSQIDEVLVEVGITEVTARDLVDVVSGYEGAGKGPSTEEELCKALVP